MTFFRSTDLPVPDGPMTAEILPRGMSKEMSSRTVCDPKLFVTFRSDIAASMGSPRWSGELGGVPVGRGPVTHGTSGGRDGTAPVGGAPRPARTGRTRRGDRIDTGSHRPAASPAPPPAPAQRGPRRPRPP